MGRERRPGPPLSKRPPCFMHSVLCDDKRQRGGWNAGLQGPKEGWANGGGGGTGVQLGSILQPLEWSPSSRAGVRSVYVDVTLVSSIPEHQS